MIRVAVAFILLIYLATAFKLEKERLAFEDQPDAQDELDEQEQQYEARERARERDDPDGQDKGEQDEANEPYEGQDDLHDEEQDEYALNETTDRDEQKERDEQDKNEEDNKVIERFTKKHTRLSNWLKSRSLSNYTKSIFFYRPINCVFRQSALLKTFTSLTPVPRFAALGARGFMFSRA